MKNKYWYGVGAGILVITIVASFVFYKQYSKNNDQVSFGAASQNEDAAQQNSAQTKTTTPASAASNLSVNSGSTARNLGQISQSGSLTDTGLGGSTPTKPSSSQSGSPSVDPSTFAQYEKYKNETQALFGDLAAGNGAALASGQTATVVYKGWLTNGQLFDESKTGSDGKLQSFQFKVGSGQVIHGWDQGLTGMKVGGTRLLIVPPSVGYGPTGQGPIPGNAVLVFLVQLIDAK